jgi:hypothetical protein
LYEGRQIYFGPTDEAKQFFVDMGFECPERQTTADFLTSLTSPAERIVRKGFEGRVPQTPDEFAAAWKNSAAHAKLVREIEEYNQEFPLGGESLNKFIESRRAMQSKNQYVYCCNHNDPKKLTFHRRIKSPFTMSVWEQVNLCMIRGFQRLKGDASLTLSQLIGNFIMALIIGSVFYRLENDTGSFYSRGALLFFAVLLNAFGSALEVCFLNYTAIAFANKLPDLDPLRPTSYRRKTSSLRHVPSVRRSYRLHAL